MQVIYNSPSYHVVEFAGHGVEVISKHTARGTWLSGAAAVRLRDGIALASAGDDPMDAVDALLADLDGIMHQLAVYH